MELGQKLKLLRKQAGLKQPQLAAKTGVTTNKIQRFEQGAHGPKGDDVLALARCLGVTADYLLDNSLPYPPPEEHLSEKVAIIEKLEGLIGALTSREAGGAAAGGEKPDVVHLPVYKLGAGFDVRFDAVGQATGDKARDMYFNNLGDGKLLAAELHGSSMRGPGESGFSLGEILVFKATEPDAVATGDYVYARTEDHGLFRQAFVHGDRIRLRALNPADPEIVVAKADVLHLYRLVRRIKEY